MSTPSSHKTEIALRAAMHELGAQAPEMIFEFLKPDRIEEAAARLAEGDPAEKVSATWVRRLFTRHGSFDKTEFGKAMFELAAEQMVELVNENAAAYLQAISAIGSGAGRETLGPVALADLDDYFLSESAEDEARWRVYHLALAAAGDHGEGLRFRELLRDRYERIQSAYWRETFQTYMDAYDRVMVEGVDPKQLQRSFAAIFEGYILHLRSGVQIGGEEIVDAMLRLLAAHTRRPDEPGLDPDRELFGRGRIDVESEPVTGSTLSGPAIYGSVLEAVEEAEPEAGEVIRHAMMHARLGGPARPRTEEGAALANACFAHIRAGGELRMLVNVDTTRQLERLLEFLTAGVDDSIPGRLEVRALLGAPPALSPLIVGERLAAVAREGDGERAVTEAIRLLDAPSIAFATAAFDDIWRSEKSVPLITDSARYPRGIQEAEVRLTALAGG